MPRPSRKQERTHEILDAYGRCIARYGVEGATLEKTAEEAGLARALIRHNVGNKEQLLDQFFARYLERSQEEVEALFDALPPDNRVAVLIDLLFDSEFSDAHEFSVTNALLNAALERPDIADAMNKSINGFTKRIGRVLKSTFPDAGAADIDAVASGLVGIYFNVDTMASMGNEKKLRRTSKRAAQLLVSTLDS